ncbi:hypothetical protein [Nibricoccus sp. IMCC34717]|uniref:hypothetical protein n=1 Tax=Nibricoccus sp. IMCC34717 TaxID=3034021 RepID=UPI00384F0707
MRLVLLPLLALALAGCLHVKTDPIEVKPIKVSIDVTVKVEKALDDLFDDIDRKSSTIKNP